jgi:T-complex protein 1 subunit alpha
MERAVHDALCVVKRVLESKTVVPGGGAVEAALSIYLENYATSLVRHEGCCLPARGWQSLPSSCTVVVP